MINSEDIKAGMILGHADTALIRDALFKLAELEKQKPIYQLIEDGNWYDAEPHVYHEEMARGNIGRIVYARPAPAVSLAELKSEPVLPDIGSNQVNDAAWKLHDRLGEYGPLTGGQFNNLKGCFYDALKVCMEVKP